MQRAWKVYVYLKQSTDVKFPSSNTVVVISRKLSWPSVNNDLGKMHKDKVTACFHREWIHFDALCLFADQVQRCWSPQHPWSSLWDEKCQNQLLQVDQPWQKKMTILETRNIEGKDTLTTCNYKQCLTNYLLSFFLSSPSTGQHCFLMIAGIHRTYSQPPLPCSMCLFQDWLLAVVASDDCHELHQSLKKDK